ncbi:ABC transporter ATP-binding protein [Planctomycetales bacterium ZRK34]|nr:ABC transporter ATP-binding protein [Planctomycetales bacterium ZRK34]
MSDCTVMSIQQVRFGYHPQQTVVDALTASVLPGKVHAIMGPNGSGKTTLLKLMLGQLAPREGRITLNDQSVHKLAARKRAATIAYVPQRSTVAFAFTAREVIELGRFALRRDDAAVEQAIDACGLHDLAEIPFVELSVGQQQRVLLARSVAQSSGQGRVLLLDEPTSAMDLAHVHRTMTLLRTLAASGLSVVVVLQDVNLAARYADRVWLMRSGRIVSEGDWSQVLDAKRLGDVYGVKMRQIAGELEAEARPIFEVSLPDAPPGG